MTAQPLAIARRTAIGSFAAAGLGFIFFGPRGDKESTDGRIVLDYWEKWTGLEGVAMQKVVNEFNQSQTRIRVRYFSTNAIDQKTQVAIAGNNPPDIVGLWNYNVPAYAEMGAILALSDIDCDPAFKVDLSRYATAMQPVMKYQGKTWAVINTGGTVALYYNKAHFREVGLDPEKPPLTISELNYANHILTKVDPNGTIQRVGFVPLEPGWWSFIWGHHFGGYLYDEKNDKSVYGSPENVKAFEWLASCASRFGKGDDIPKADATLNKNLKASSLTEIEKFRSSFGNYDSPLNAFLTGKISMVVQGPWIANVINAYKKDLDYNATPFPVIDGIYDAANPIGLIDTDILVIPRGTTHPEACMEFIAYTQQQRNVEFLSTVHCKNSPLVQVSPDFIKNHPNKGISVHARLANSSRGFRCPVTRTWLQFKDLSDANMQQVWTQKAPASILLAQAQTRIQRILDESHATRERRRT